MSFLDAFTEFVDDVWYLVFVLVIFLGLYCTIRLKGIQFTQLKEMFRVTFRKEDIRNKEKLSSFRVFCMSMGNRIGVGNITGPVLAFIIGGPGAIFWIWVFAVIGMATSFLETTVGQIFKTRTKNGEYHGGPAYNVSNGLGLKRMSVIVAVVVMLMYIVGFVSMEVCSMSEAMVGAFDFEGNKIFFAVLFTLITAAVIIGGIKRVSDMTVGIVPIMALGWFLICIVSIIANFGNLGSAITSIFANAFTVPSTVGGGVGAMLIIGMKRGILSNESGIGTIPNLSSMADVRHPVSQGLSQSFGVLIDTVICTMTALVIMTGVDHATATSLDLESAMLLQHVFEFTFGGFASYLVALFLFIFAFTSLMTDYVIGENNVLFFGEQKWKLIVMNILILVVVFLSSFYSSDALFVFVDLMMAACGIINVIVMSKLGKYAIEAYADYRRQKAEGIEEPDFHKSALSNPSGVTVWDD